MLIGEKKVLTATKALAINGLKTFLFMPIINELEGERILLLADFKILIPKLDVPIK
jgi:hypothetical protein